ncbi:MAG: ABC transporter ATP-binding protein [Dehalococcoidia bacterium]|jgi:tungstate transport system ATP-binding protein
MSLIEVAGVTHKYDGKPILQNVNVSVDRGDTFALIGPTGAGKTTLLRIVDLLEIPRAGEIYFDGIRIPQSGKQRLEIRRRISFIHQKPQVFNLSVYDNVACGLRWRGLEKSKIAGRVDHILEMVGLEGYESRNARTLSGGEAQRVALARSLVLEPEVLLLDEPTANLDPVSATKIEQLIQYIARQRNTTMIMATHVMSQGQQLADRIGVLLGGKLVQTGTVTDIFQSPQNEQVAHFVGMENILEGIIVTNDQGIATVNIGGNAIQAVSNYPPRKEIYACIRPEDITLALSSTKSSARNCFQAKITRVTFIGPLSRVEIDCGSWLVALVTKISAEELNLRAGKEVYATFKATAVHIVERKAS